MTRRRSLLLATLTVAALIVAATVATTRGPDLHAWNPTELRTLRSLSLSSLPPLPPDPSNPGADDPEYVHCNPVWSPETRTRPRWATGSSSTRR